MRVRKGESKIKTLFICLMITMLGLFSSNAEAVDVDFHGYFESNLILRDVDGFQYGFMDHVNAIQQRNTLKFDVDVGNIDYGLVRNIKFDKIHLTYRGAYDSIFDLREDAYDGITKVKKDRFLYAKDDIRFENGLREATVDLSYQGTAGKSFLRLGSQLVSWGEGPPLTILDVVNPSDNSFQMFFLNPDDLKIPLWMARYNHSLPDMGPVKLNIDLLYVPDVRPQQFGPLDSSMQAPYSNITLKSMAAFAVKETVNQDRKEFGAQVSSKIGPYLDLAAVYYEGINDAPAVVLEDWVGPAPKTANFTHPWTRTYGATFAYYVQPPVDIIVSGEFGMTEGKPVSLPGTAPDMTMGPGGILYAKTFRQKDVMSGMVGVSKAFWWKWFSDSMINVSLKYQQTRIQGWEPVFDRSSNSEVGHYINAALSWDWFHGSVAPLLYATYDTTGTWNARAQVQWKIDTHWYAFLQTMAFFGNKDAKSPFSSMINTVGETTFKIGYQW